VCVCVCVRAHECGVRDRILYPVDGGKCSTQMHPRSQRILLSVSGNWPFPQNSGRKDYLSVECISLLFL
jgi:hypothetical protein